MSITENLLNAMGSLVSFNVYPSAIIGANFTRVKVLGVYDARVAMRFADVASLHVNVYPTLPPGSGEKYTDYKYVEIEHPDGQTSIIGIPWIVASTLLIHSNTQAHFIVSNITPADLEIIRQQIIGAGYMDVQGTLL